MTGSRTCSRLRACSAGLLSALALLAPKPAEAFLFEEHANIGRDAVGGLSLSDRKELERLWDAALAVDREAQKRLLHWSKESAVDDVDYQRKPTHNRVTESEGAFLDFGALPATAADHSCSPVDMWNTATRQTWFPAVYTDVGKTEALLHDENPSTPAKLDAWHQGNLDLLRDDPDYLPRSSSNNAHFVFARTGQVFIDDYLLEASKAGTAMNATVAYSFYHVAALAAAAKLATLEKKSAAYGAWSIRVLSIESFALHFLEDSFASGHFVGFTTLGSASERTGTHDYYCENGLAARTWGASPNQSASSSAAIRDLLQDGKHEATELEVDQCLGEWRGGVSYAAHGDAFQSTPGDLVDSTGAEGCPLVPANSSDRAMAARAVRLSLHQVIEVAAGKVPIPVGIDPNADDLASLNVCTETVVTAREEGLVRAATPYLSVVLSMTPTPYRSDVQMPRFRSDYGVMIRGSAASRVGLAFGAGDNARFQGVLQVGLGIGGNLEALTTRSTDGLFYVEANAIGYGAEEPSDCVACTPAPSRVGGGVRAHLPFMLIPGDTLIALGPLLVGQYRVAEQLALRAARGSLWGRFERVHAHNLYSWQILVGRQFAVYRSGANGFTMTDLELPWVELRTRHLFSQKLGSDGAIQLGNTIEWDRLVTPEATRRDMAGSVYLRFAFDTQYDLYP